MQLTTSRLDYRNACVMSVAILLAAGTVAPAQDLPPEVVHHADAVFFNGTVLTLDTDEGDFTIAQALAVRDGRVLAVGTTDRILRMAGPQTRRMDLQGKTVLPGIVNTHIHPNRSALSNYRSELPLEFTNVKFLASPPLRRWESKEQVLADMRRIVTDAPPDQKWITIAGVPRVEAQLPDGVKIAYQRATNVPRSLTLADLDAVSPDKPLAVSIREYYGLANSKAIEAMQKRYGQDMPGIDRDENGRPTGQFIGGVPIRVIQQDFLPQIPSEALREPFRKELKEKIAPQGMTTISTRLNSNEARAYMLLDLAGEMPLRLAYGHEIGRFNPQFERDMIWNMQVPLGAGSDMVWLSGISVGLPDGQPGSHICTTWPQIVETRDVDVGGLGGVGSIPTGICTWDLPGDPSRETIRVLSRMGYRVSNVHSYGDGALEQAMDIFAEVGAAGKRFAMDHSQLFNPRVITKAGKLTAYFSLSPAMFMGERTQIVAHQFGREVADNMLAPVKALLEAGAKVTFEGEFEGSDPMTALEVFVTRLDRTGVARGLKHAVDRKTALRIMTRWGAEYVLAEDRIGSLEPGKFADLIVLDRNPLDASAVPDDQLSDLKVLLTMVGGKVVHGSF